MNRLRVMASACAILAGVPAITPVNAAAPALSTVEATLKQFGARKTLEQHFPCDAADGAGYEPVASGAPGWVALAATLIGEADACYTEGLQDALGRAMQRTPGRVLPLVGRSSPLAAERICLPFVSAELPLPAQRAVLSRSRHAIAAVKAPRLKAARRACLEVIDHAAALHQGAGTE